MGRGFVYYMPMEAHAWDLAGEPDSAIAVFTRYIETPDPWKCGDMWDVGQAADAMWLARANRRLGELWEAKGDRARASRYYARFVELWKDSDVALQPQVADVRRRLQRLERVRGG